MTPPPSVPGRAWTVPGFVEVMKARGVELLATEGQTISFRAPVGAIGALERGYVAFNREILHAYLVARQHGTRPPLGVIAAPLAPALEQETWWHRTAMTEGPIPSENVGLVIVVTCPDRARVVSAIRRVVRRHDVLRYRFNETREGLKVELNDADTLKIEISEAAVLDSARERVAAFSNRRLPMTEPWLIAVKAVFTLDGHVVLALRLHHAVFDGGSMPILTRELVQAIEGVPSGDEAGQITFQHVAAWESAWLESPAGATVDRYWSAWSAQMPLLQAPSGRLLIWSTGKSAFQKLQMPPALALVLEAVASRIGAALADLLLAAFAIALWRWSGQGRFAVRTVKDSRSRVELANMVGPLIAYDPLEILIDPDLGFADFVQAMQSEAAAARDLSFPMHVRPMSTNFLSFFPRIGATYNFDRPRSSVPRPSSRTTAVVWPKPKRELAEGDGWTCPVTPIHLRCGYVGDALRCDFSFSLELITLEEQAHLADLFLDTLKHVTADPTLAIGAL